MAVVPDPRSAELPGYQRLARASGARDDFRIAYNTLGLRMSAKDAEAFLEEKIKAAVPNNEKRQETVLQICLGFACLSVHAEREEQEHLQQLERPGSLPPAEEDRDEGDDPLGEPGLKW